jgi:hypothetical protein
MIEQVISHFKNRTIIHTDYRRPIETFPGDYLSGNLPALLQDGLNKPQ